MELTYQIIKKMLLEYFDSLPSISGPQDKARIKEFFTPDFKVRWAFNGRVSVTQTREEWVHHLCGHPNEYRAVVHYQPPPLGILIDEKKKLATMLICEEFLHPVTGFSVKPKEYVANYWELALHEGKVKARREMINVIDMANLHTIWGTYSK
jgi:hypothetical protein